MIPFNVPPCTGNEFQYVEDAIRNRKLCGDGPYTKKCHEWFEKNLPAKKVLLTTSCTHALEMTAYLLDVGDGDEIILPSFTFVSTANAFAIRGARLVFVDIDPRTMNMDPAQVHRAMTPRTKAIVAVHYAGVGCEMDEIMAMASARNIPVVEDAAQGFMSRYHGRMLGTIGTFGCYSFHETKNLTCGEGGLLIIGDDSYGERAEIIREKGTNRARFIRGMVDKYTWVDVGSSYLPSELNAAFLLSQLESVETIQEDRLRTWSRYASLLKDLENDGRIGLPFVPLGTEHNAHMFYIKTNDIAERSRLTEFLKARGIGSALHYIPLHSSPRGALCGRFVGEDRWTTTESERLLRLPLWYGMREDDTRAVAESVIEFYERQA